MIVTPRNVSGIPSTGRILLRARRCFFPAIRFAREDLPTVTFGGRPSRGTGLRIIEVRFAQRHFLSCAFLVSALVGRDLRKGADHPHGRGKSVMGL